MCEISSLSDQDLREAINEYEYLVAKKTLGDNLLRSLAKKMLGSDNIDNLILTGLYCYRELYLRSQKNA